jgi:glycolate oxidase FAD binding subunit
MSIPPELATACADVREAGDGDSIAGRRARYVAAPDSTAEASALLRAAAALGLTVVPRGAGRLQHWGNPPASCDLIIDTRRLDRIVEHRPADLTVTVQAGVRFRDLERALAPAHQTVALFPPRPAAAGTVGGLIATNAAGSHQYGHGTPRDRLTAITAVRADGTIVATDGATPGAAAPGGGPDLIALLAGSFGSLGLITEATFRLEPTPQIAYGMTIPCDGPEHAQRLVGEVSDPAIAPLGVDLRWPSAAEPLRLFATIHGTRADVNERSALVYALAGREAPPSVDTARARRLDDPDHGGLPADVAERLLADQARIRAEIEDPPADTGTLVRVLIPPARLAAALTLIRAIAAETGIDVAIDGSAIVGVLGVKVPAAMPGATVAAFVASLRSRLGQLTPAGSGTAVVRAVVVYAPDEARELTDAHGPVPSLARLLAIKDEFDPEHRMAPGRLADAV